jgi:hypothetical protein
VIGEEDAVRFRLTQFCVALAGCGLLLTQGTEARATTVFTQGFETDTAGWLGDGNTSTWPWGTITRVASGGGTLGVASASGSYHAEVTTSSVGSSGASTRFGGYSSVWPGGFSQSLDIYIDPSQGNIGDGWFLDNALYSNTGSWLEAGGVGAEKTAAGTWSLAADWDGASYPGGGIDVTTAGWYTIVSEWTEEGTKVGRNTYVYDSLGTEIYSATLQSGQQDIANAGGWGYGWVGRSTAPAGFTLAIDNSSLTTVPEPGVATLFGLGIAGLAWRSRRDRTASR